MLQNAGTVCPRCGHDLRGARLIEYSTQCPECGGVYEAWTLGANDNRSKWSVAAAYALFGVGGGVAVICIALFSYAVLWVFPPLQAQSSGSVSAPQIVVSRVLSIVIPLGVWVGVLLMAWLWIRESLSRSGWPQSGAWAMRHVRCIVLVHLGLVVAFAAFALLIAVLP